METITKKHIEQIQKISIINFANTIDDSNYDDVIRIALFNVQEMYPYTRLYAYVSKFIIQKIYGISRYEIKEGSKRAVPVRDYKKDEPIIIQNIKIETMPFDKEVQEYLIVDAGVKKYCVDLCEGWAIIQST